MSLYSDLTDVLTPYAQRIKDVKAGLGDLDELETTAKTDLVSAINEAASSGGSGLTADIKEALLQLASKVAYIDDGGQGYYDALYDALYPSANLTSISCVYTQGGAVYDTDSLDTLKGDLVVTAHYDDSTTETISTYTLSGTLTEGTSTITVLYGGKTDTFSVTVSHVDNTIRYRLPQTTVFDGSSTVINTGVAAFSSDSDFSIVCAFKANVTQNKFCAVWAAGDTSIMYMIRPTDASTGVWTTYAGNKLSIGANVTIHNDNDVVRYVLRHVTGNKFEVFASVNGTTTVNGTELGSAQMTTTAIEVRLGKSYANNTYFTGTVSDFLIYSRALNDTEIATYLAGGE